MLSELQYFLCPRGGASDLEINTFAPVAHNLDQRELERREQACIFIAIN